MLEELWKCNGSINFLNFLTRASDFCKSSVHWVFIFPTFSCARLSVIFCESSNTATNSKVDGRSSINFWVLIKNPKFRSRISTYPKQLVVLLEKLPSRSHLLDISQFLYIVSAAKILELLLIWWKLLVLKKVRSIDIKIRITRLSIRTWHISVSFLTTKPQNMRLLNQSWT